jgi:CRISPR-associated endoribonuclease Cas6
MRLRLLLGKRGTPFRVPRHYNYPLQSLIYRYLDEHLATQLHDEGFGNGAKRFKFFTFSRLIGDFQQEGEQLVFTRGATLYIASPNMAFLESLLMHLLTIGELTIKGANIPIHKVEALPMPEYQPEVILKALAPITVRATLQQPHEKYTYYYTPHEPDFSPRIIANLAEKVSIWHGRAIDPGDAYCLPYAVDEQRNFHMVSFKGTWVKGWSGLYRFRAPREYFELALDAGLGERNSGGFGCVEVYTPKPRTVNSARELNSARRSRYNKQVEGL